MLSIPPKSLEITTLGPILQNKITKLLDLFDLVAVPEVVAMAQGYVLLLAVKRQVVPLGQVLMQTRWWQRSNNATWSTLLVLRIWLSDWFLGLHVSAENLKRG